MHFSGGSAAMLRTGRAAGTLDHTLVVAHHARAAALEWGIGSPNLADWVKICTTTLYCWQTP